MQRFEQLFIVFCLAFMGMFCTISLAMVFCIMANINVALTFNFGLNVSAIFGILAVVVRAIMR